MDHAAFRELAAGAVLEDLDRDERVRFEAHRAGCRACGWLVEDLLDVTAGLALVAPPRQAPAGLRSVVLDAIRASGTDDGSTAVPRDQLPSAETRPITRPTTRPRLRLLTGPGIHRLLGVAAVGLAACLVLAAVALGARSGDLSRQLDEARAAGDQARAELALQGEAMAVAADPAHRTATLHPEPVAPAATAFVMYVPGTSRSYLMASDLPATPAGKVYELWMADAAGVHGLGTYSFDGHGAFVAPLGVDLAGAKATMVTLEAAGGAIGQPGPQVVFGDL